jgi:hypothetical protein
MERSWCVTGQRGSNSVALGYDEGSIIIKVLCTLCIHRCQDTTLAPF